MTNDNMHLDDVSYLLSNPFNPASVKWRLGSTNQKSVARDTGNQYAKPTKGQPLCYVDAVLGSHNWQDEYIETPKRIICKLGVRHGDEWIWKSDGAGDTNMEGEKGGLSDAFKRAAVKFGIGRYLYSIHSNWIDLNEHGQIPKGWKERDGIALLNQVQPSVWKSKQMKTKYYKGLKSFAADNDAGGVRELWNELTAEQQKDIWHDLGPSSGVRSTIKELLDATDNHASRRNNG